MIQPQELRMGNLVYNRHKEVTDRPTFRLAERYGLIECKPVDRVVFYFETL